MSDNMNNPAPKKRGRPKKIITAGIIPTEKEVQEKNLIDREKIRLAKKQEKMIKGGLMMGIQRPFTTPNPTSHLQSYYTSYTDGSNFTSGMSDIPLYFQVMNQQNGGLLYWPATLREKYQWYRYFSRCDAYVGRALEILSFLPLSKISLNMPSSEEMPEEMKSRVYDFYKHMCDHLNLFEKLQQILWEYNTIGNTFAFAEFSEEKGMWDKIVILPPEEVRIWYKPFSDEAHIEYRPERLCSLIKGMQDGMFNVSNYDLSGSSEGMDKLLENIPEDVIDRIRQDDSIGFDTDPNTGSFVYHFARNRAPYQDLGVSVLERILIPMLVKEHYRFTQVSLSSRNMTPKNKIAAPGIGPGQLDDLRYQVDSSYMDPDYTIVTNYDWTWEQIGAEGRILPLDSEYDRLENQVFAALGVTRELMTGEGTFGGNRITIDMLNSFFLLIRDMIQVYVEKYLFQPIADKKGWFTKNEDGIKKYWYPKIGFNRITIRDNQEVFESLFQLYQKGSLPVDVIYELFNLDSNSMHDKIYKDMFTVKDSMFNELLRNLNGGVAEKILEGSNFESRMIDYLKLKQKGAEGEEGGGGMGEELGKPMGGEMGGGKPEGGLSLGTPGA